MGILADFYDCRYRLSLEIEVINNFAMERLFSRVVFSGGRILQEMPSISKI